MKEIKVDAWIERSLDKLLEQLGILSDWLWYVLVRFTVVDDLD